VSRQADVRGTIRILTHRKGNMKVQTTELTEIEGFILDLIRSGGTPTASRITKEVCRRFGHPIYRGDGPDRDRRVDNALRRLKNRGLIEFKRGGWPSQAAWTERKDYRRTT
jgi:hypothetical protein